MLYVVEHILNVSCALNSVTTKLLTTANHAGKWGQMDCQREEAQWQRKKGAHRL